MNRKTRSKKIAVAAVMLAIVNECTNEELRKRKRSEWQKEWISRREEQGMFHNLFAELALTDPDMYRRCLRLNVDMFEELLRKVTPIIQKQDTNMRKSISAGEQLSIVLRHIATGETQTSLQLTFRVSQAAISLMIPPVCEAIFEVLKDDYVRVPASSAEWKNIAHGFSERWQFPNCIGALDGKHVLIDPPIKSGSLFYNYKGHYSIVLMALVDSEQRFTYIDVGTNGRVSDGGVWAKCSLRNALEANIMNLPQPDLIPDTDIVMPYVIVADDAFPLTEYIMKGYPTNDLERQYDRRIFNYRLSRARMCSENAFGILSNRFLIYRSAMRYDPAKTTTIVMATIALHNWLRTERVGRAMYTPPGSIDEEDIFAGKSTPGSWRDDAAPTGMVPIIRMAGNRNTNAARAMRDKLCQFFSEEGAVPWQDRMVQKLK